MLLPRQKPSSSYSLLKFVYVISQLVVHPLLRIILDPPLQLLSPKQNFPLPRPPIGNIVLPSFINSLFCSFLWVENKWDTE